MKYKESDKTVSNSEAEPVIMLERNANEDAEREMLDENPADMIGTQNLVDNLQNSVYQAGRRVLSVLRQKELITEELELITEGRKSNLKLDEILEGLGTFTYNVGFAGEQSCGKSTVINSLLQYPVMPTCTQVTTSSVVRIAYSKHFRIRAFDDDTQTVVLDFDCERPSETIKQEKFGEQFDKLLDYGISAMDILVIENFQYFSIIDVMNDTVTKENIEMDQNDPRQVMLLLLILLAVYVGQNDKEWNAEKAGLMKKREKLFRYFGIPENTINISVFCQADFEILKSGLIITDLPGLGSVVDSGERNGRKIKGHDEITKNAIRETDTMIFLSTPENRREGYEVLSAMLSSAKLMEVVFKGNRIIPVLNKADCGAAVRKTAICAFRDALLNHEVDKAEGDIIPYAAIFGEYKYADVLFERTLFFKSNYDEERIDAEQGEIGNEEAYMKELEILRSKLKKKYEKSGIEEFRRFFRTDLVEGGKYNKAVTAIQTIRAIFSSQISPLEASMEACATMYSARTALTQGMMQKLKSAIMDPEGVNTDRQNEKLEMISAEVPDQLEKYIDIVSSSYTDAFHAALEKYRIRLLEILKKFQLTWLGLGSKARIDQPGSVNKEIYAELLGEIGKLPVSLEKVDLNYRKALEYVGEKIDGFYTDTINGLMGLRTDIRSSLDRFISQAMDEKLSDTELDAMEQLKNQLINFFDKQIEATSIILINRRQVATKAQKEIIDSIFSLNKKMVEQFTLSIRNELVSRLSVGGFLISKEYLRIDGEGGMKIAVACLHLSEAEEENMKLNIETESHRILGGLVGEWINELYDILPVYAVLGKQMQKPVEDMESMLSGSAEENKEMMEVLQCKIDQWNRIGDTYRQEVQQSFRDASVYMNDEEPDAIRLQKDILFNCFSGRDIA